MCGRCERVRSVETISVGAINIFREASSATCAEAETKTSNIRLSTYQFERLIAIVHISSWSGEVGDSLFALPSSSITLVTTSAGSKFAPQKSYYVG